MGGVRAVDDGERAAVSIVTHIHLTGTHPVTDDLVAEAIHGDS